MPHSPGRWETEAPSSYELGLLNQTFVQNPIPPRALLRGLCQLASPVRASTTSSTGLEDSTTHLTEQAGGLNQVSHKQRARHTAGVTLTCSACPNFAPRLGSLSQHTLVFHQVVTHYKLVPAPKSALARASAYNALPLDPPMAGSFSSFKSQLLSHLRDRPCHLS